MELAEPESGANNLITVVHKKWLNIITETCSGALHSSHLGLQALAGQQASVGCLAKKLDLI